MPSRSYRSRRARRRILAHRLLAALVALVVLVVLAGAIQLARGAPTANASVVLPVAVRTPGRAARLPWPSQGAAAVEVEGVGSLGGVRTRLSWPLASVTKLITALVVLKDHPLTAGEAGPALTVTAADVAAYQADLAADDSVLAVQAGEQLTERQALEGMLIPSGDNVADLLADWDAGSESAFVARMNAEARALGLDHTHLADPAGLDPRSVGTASDLVELAGDVMANPVLRRIVALPQVTLPVAGTVYNYDAALGRDGIVGIKTGSTTQAGGNFVFAAERRVDGRTLTVLGAVLGQGGGQPLGTALAVGERLARAAFGAVRPTTVLAAGRDVLTVRAPWGTTVVGKTAAAVKVLAVPGEDVGARVELASSLAGGVTSLRTGERVATVDLRVGGRAIADPVVASARLSPASVSYRLTRF